MYKNLRKNRKSCHTKPIITKYLKIMHYNIEGVLSETHGSKLNDEDFIAVVQGHDIVALTETHAGYDDNLEIPGYVVKSLVRPKSSRARKYSGGIVLAIKKSISRSVTVIESESDNIIWAKINRRGAGKDLLIGIVYISPINSSYTNNVLPNQYKTWEILEDEIMKFKSIYNICLLGDFNARTAKLLDYIVNDDDRYVDIPVDYIMDVGNTKRNNSDQCTNVFGNRLLELCRASEIRIVNGRKLGDTSGKKTCYQWNGCSTVDYLLADTSTFSHIQTFQVMNLIPHLSDHCPISTVINVTIYAETITKTQGVLGAPKRIKWDDTVRKIFTTKLSSSQTKERLESLSKMEMCQTDTIEDAVGAITCILAEAANIRRLSNNPKRKKQNSKDSKPWFSNELVKAKNALKRASKAFIKDNNNISLRQELFKLKKDYKRLVKRNKRRFRQDIYNKLEEMDKTNPKAYWELFHSLKNCNNSTNRACPIDNQEWIKHYTKLLGTKKYDESKVNNIKNEISMLCAEPFFSELDFRITHKEIEKATKSLKNGKAVGIDQISNEMIKLAINHIMKPMEKIFNAILCEQYYPSMWKIGIITNLHKTGNTMDPNNYRGLTINSCIAKVFNTIMNNRLTKYLEENDIISNKQIGFRKNARTSDHIFVINTLFRKLSSIKKTMYVCFIDFQKAYDSVWRDALMLKLLRIGVKGNFFGVIKDMYAQCEACIKSEGTLSPLFSCETGVKQGDVMSPNLFNVYINDLPDIFNGDTDSPALDTHAVHCLLYADDLVLLSLSLNGLQDKLNKLHIYCKQWELTINVKKSKVMILSPNTTSFPSEVLKIGDLPLEWVSNYKYLGIEIHSNGNMVAASENLCTRGWKATFKLKSTLKDMDVQPATRLKLFDTLIKPIICYGSDVWGPLINLQNSKSVDIFWRKSEKLPVETFQLKYCKNVLGVHSKATNAAVMGELGRLPVTLFLIKTSLRFCQHIEEVGDRMPLLMAAVAEDKILNGNKSWRRSLENILNLFKFSLNGNAINDNFITKVMEKMKAKYIEYWRNSLGDTNNNNGKLYIYRKIKSNYQLEPYLNHVTKSKHRRSMTALRISTHKLEIETGRHATKNNQIIRRDERLCTLCRQNNVSCVGDEEHALLVCPTFEKQRREVVNFIGDQYPSFHKLDNRGKMIYMLTCENMFAQRVSKFIHEILSMKRPRIGTV